MSRVFVMCGFCAIVSAAQGDVIWTETFDTGVGRFDQFRGLGETKFVWNSSTQQIDGEFERRTSGRLDRRYAVLGHTLTHDDVAGFSVVVTPTGISADLHTAAYLGFWNSTTEEVIGVRVGRPGGIHISAFGSGLDEPQVDFEFGQTYFIDLFYNGLDLITMDVYLGRDACGPLVGSTSLAREPTDTFEVDSLYMGNPGQGSTTFWASVDDFSYYEERPVCRVDLTYDCIVDTLDFLAFLGLWVIQDPIADWNEDGQHDTLDFLAFLNEWLAGC